MGSLTRINQQRKSLRLIFLASAGKHAVALLETGVHCIYTAHGTRVTV